MGMFLVERVVEIHHGNQHRRSPISALTLLYLLWFLLCLCVLFVSGEVEGTFTH